MTKPEFTAQRLLLQRLRNGYYPHRHEDLLSQVEMEKRFCEEHAVPAEERNLTPGLSWKIRQRFRLTPEEAFSVLGMAVLPFRPTAPVTGEVDWPWALRPMDPSHV